MDMSRAYGKGQIRLWIVRMLTLIWMLVIFSFSAKPAEASTQDSLYVGRKIGQLVYKDFTEWEESSQTAFAKKIEYPVRKGAHMTEYAILGVLIRFCWKDKKDGRKRRAVSSWFLTVAYASTDEFHQLFVPGRSGQVKDVMIDSVGAAIGIFLISFIYFLYEKKQKPAE